MVLASEPVCRRSSCLVTILTIYENWFSIVIPCYTYVSTVMRSAFADILVPGTSAIDVRAQHDPETNFILFLISYFLY